MKNLEKITNFLLAIGAVLTAASGIYSEYNKSKVSEEATKD